MATDLSAPAPPQSVSALSAPICAARYGRRSKGDQENSIDIQFGAIDVYAAVRNMRIVRTYLDDGISGLTAEREALQDLIEVVQSGRADFTAILVYDVSRWGRYQDVDQSAYYEFICRSYGIAVHYCAEPFENDGSFFAAIAKGLKRAAAADYSRDLSVKVFAGLALLVRRGFLAGGSPGYGLRRLLVDQAGTVKFQLGRGERKSITSDRSVLVPGPLEEVKTIRWIFSAFVKKRKSEYEIAKILNRRGVPSPNGRQWLRRSIFRILLNERYIGNYVWNHESAKLKSKLVANPPEKWIRADGVIEPIVDGRLFEAAQEIVRERLRELTEEEKLKPVRLLLRKHGFLSKRIIDAGEGLPSAATYHRWFGGLLPLYKLVGFTGHRKWTRRAGPFRSCGAVTMRLSDDDLLDLLRESLREHGYLSRKIIDETEGIPAAATYYVRFGSMKRAYKLVGFPQDFHNAAAEGNGARSIGSRGACRTAKCSRFFGNFCANTAISTTT
jgi:DNA invertase Pin-like site-specific DNA recombinase